MPDQMTAPDDRKPTLVEPEEASVMLAASFALDHIGVTYKDGDGDDQLMGGVLRKLLRRAGWDFGDGMEPTYTYRSPR